MSELWNDFTDKLGSLAGKWTAFTAFGSFVVYLLGYLALRFQLSTYGVATNLDVWDERYLFAGSRFLVYLVSSVPNVLLIVMVLVVIAYLPYRLVPAGVRGRMKQRATAWAAHPTALPLLGTLLALGLIQLVMRKCFVLGNLLLAKKLPEYEWIDAVLLSDDGNRSLYFSGLVGGTLLTGVLLLFAIRTGSAATSLSKLLVGLLAFLVAVEFLLLPVNYAILIASQICPLSTSSPGPFSVLGLAEIPLILSSLCQNGSVLCFREACWLPAVGPCARAQRTAVSEMSNMATQASLLFMAVPLFRNPPRPLFRGPKEHAKNWIVGHDLYFGILPRDGDHGPLTPWCSDKINHSFLAFPDQPSLFSVGQLFVAAELRHAGKFLAGDQDGIINRQ